MLPPRRPIVDSNHSTNVTLLTLFKVVVPEKTFSRALVIPSSRAAFLSSDELCRSKMSWRIELEKSRSPHIAVRLLVCTHAARCLHPCWQSPVSASMRFRIEVSTTDRFRLDTFPAFINDDFRPHKIEIPFFFPQKPAACIAELNDSAVDLCH